MLISYQHHVDGTGQAGVYFIAFSLFSAISSLATILLIIAYSILSAMEDGRKRFAWRVIKLSLLISIPISYSAIFHSEQIMELFGENYVAASFSFEILLVSTLPITIVTGIKTLMNSYGNYRYVLAIGMASNIPTVIMYFILVPIYQNNAGAAISYTVG